MAVAAVLSRLWPQMLKFLRKNAHCGLWWGPYQRSLREERDAQPGAKIMENVRFGPLWDEEEAGGFPDVPAGRSEAPSGEPRGWMIIQNILNIL